MMKCRQVSDLVSDYFDGYLDRWTQLQMRFHLMMCKDCRAHLKKMRHLVDSLGYLPPDTEVPEEMVARLKKFLPDS
jgi:predicted anti-sigma-YlaC factor YlaD